MLKFAILKARRKAYLLNWNLILISGIIIVTSILFILIISGSPKSESRSSGLRSNLEQRLKGSLERVVLGLVDEPFCKIESYKRISIAAADAVGVVNIKETGRSFNSLHYTEVRSLTDGSYVIFKRTSPAEQTCVKCCAKYIYIDTLKTYVDGHLPRGDLQTISRSYCRSFVKVIPLEANKYNFVQTKCEVQCHNRADPDVSKRIFTRIHPLLKLSSKVRRKLEYWQHQQAPRTPIKVLLLNLDVLSRAQALIHLPETVRTMRELGFVGMEGHALIAGSSISNFVGSLTGLAESEWDEACGFSETGHFTSSCPWIWKDFGKARFITSYFDLSGKDFFSSAPTDYYIGQDVIKLRNRTSDEESLDLLLQFTLQFNEKFSNVPTFSITRLPSHLKLFPQLDVELSKFLIRIKGLQNTFLAIYSNSGPNEFELTRGPNLERLNPVLFIRRFRSPLRLLTSLDSSFVRNSRLLTTVWDFYETLRHLLRLSCFPYDLQVNGLNDSTRCVAEYPPRAGAVSLLTPLSHYRICSDTNVPLEVCPCNRMLGSTNLLIPLLPLARLALEHLNSLVPHNGTCYQFKLVTLLYGYPLHQDNGFIVGISVTTAGTRRSDEMRLEQRLRGIDGNSNWKAVGNPLWTSHHGTNNRHQCLPFARYPKLFFVQKQFCICK